ncbi:MAG: nicotinate (nicotinamide) nucleotide adenylyltransferase [Paludibacter sp.]|nr:nicotinate (nicotinamide) nucleotide adenylyltransferase [Bacteroidales bacterium]MCM1069276.1 nicotinate (nicotinamide) nucleotide adenylyltransferase [Prevotella sp.]MCM1353741.1 nicotinate (nicotinamide) nucleotide adenylyltransferase [Bacteroides sp.]MCM1442191.1 nicotinate (nicotinamide) nucleotide adenylyltransferase [Muribaculum sp.]MCM1482153.1 nicotinate (nicotinamide) nucleotide adenylyltransferase [Paludibacter sp.]
MNIGFYPGSFNPVHKGHICLAEYILNHTSIEEVWLSVSPNNPLKSRNELCDEQVRYTWLSEALQGKTGLRACDIELQLPRPSYTIDTLHALTQRYPEHKFSLIMGADNLTIFTKWKEWESILRDYPLIVYPRLGNDLTTLQATYPNVTFLPDAPIFPISSTEIRQRLSNGEDVSNWIPAKVKLIRTDIL